MKWVGGVRARAVRSASPLRLRQDKGKAVLVAPHQSRSVAALALGDICADYPALTLRSSGQAGWASLWRAAGAGAEALGRNERHRDSSTSAKVNEGRRMCLCSAARLRRRPLHGIDGAS